MATMIDERKKTSAADKERSEVERVYYLIRDWMIASELPPGSFLSEPEIAERCGTSRTPIREALSRLAQDGWVDSIHRKGFQVRPVTLRDLSELFTYRRLFERYAGERAAATASSEHILELENIVALEERPNIAMKELSELNERFHLGLAFRTENQRIIGQMRLIMAYCHRLNPLFMTFVDSVSHRQILEAVKSRDGVLAGSLAAEHVEFALSSMIKSFCQ
jgi:DNA-binding GntR family transcriptional regulator